MEILKEEVLAELVGSLIDFKNKRKNGGVWNFWVLFVGIFSLLASIVEGMK